MRLAEVFDPLRRRGAAGGDRGGELIDVLAQGQRGVEQAPPRSSSPPPSRAAIAASSGRQHPRVRRPLRDVLGARRCS